MGVGDWLALFYAHFFRRVFLSRMNAEFHRLRDVLKRHPCRIGLNRTSLSGSPLVSTFCQEKSRRKRST